LKTFSEKLRLFQGLRGFLNTFLVESLFRNVVLAFINPIAALAFWSQSAPETNHVFGGLSERVDP
jgi:hypothetical protein